MGLRRQSGTYSASFKQSVLLKIPKHELSDIEAAALLGIHDSGHIAKCGGIEALARKRPETGIPHHYPPQPVSKDLTKEELIEDVANLRAELN